MPPASPPSALRRLGRFCYRRHWTVITVWIVALVVLFVASGAIGSRYSDSFGDFRSEATRGFDLIQQGFGQSTGENRGSIVFTADQGVNDPQVRRAMETFFAEVARIGHGDMQVESPYTNPRQIATTGPLAGKLAYATVDLPGNVHFNKVTGYVHDMRRVRPKLVGLRVLLGGQEFAEFHPPESEALGIGFAIVILILAFGSVLAMGLPIAMALGGIAAGVAMVGVVSNLITMPQFTTTLAVMLGLGVGIDYALFIVTRYREDRHRGMSGEDAAGHALDTAGRAVLFAGITVTISVLGMLVMGLGFIRGIGIGAAIAVVFTLVASMTLLPALLGAVKDRIEVTRRRGIVAAALVAVGLVGVGLHKPAAGFLILLALAVLVVGSFLPALKAPLPPRRHRETRETRWYRYSRFVQRHSWLGAISGLLVLLILALPVLGLRLGFADEGNYPDGTDTKVAYDLLAKGFGPGFNGPLQLVARVPDGTSPATLERVTQQLRATDGIAGAQGPRMSRDGTIAQWFAIPTTAPQDKATESLVRRLRGDALAPATQGTHMHVLVTSFTALGIDFSDYLAGRYLAFFSVVLGLSFLLLMVVFRSVLVPLKAVIVNLLSIGAAYGLVVLVFQHGHGAPLLGLSSHGAPIEPFIPMMLFAIVFGLSMDYEVFLLSRMKEEYDRTGDNRNAVADGLAITARVITAAALIMVTVFGSFLLEHDRVIKLMGFGLATAVLLDATIVRMLLVPSTMELLGDRNWWLPRWLDRILPTVHVEAPPEHEPDEPDEPDERELVGTGV
jgi:putative drug exporter of the RND superfamily